MENADYVANRENDGCSFASNALRLNAYVYSTSSVQERLMQSESETEQARRARVEKEMAEIERRIGGKP
jgi:hypothetical protein